MLSRKDRRARHVEFHKGKNLIQGRNHTGKSSLIKTLFLTLGAKPQGQFDKWDENTISLVEFRADGRKFRALHQAGTRALFDEDGNMLIATGDRAEWIAEFASATGFNLVLTDKNAQTIPADPRCFFIPFYINQDGSWQAGWETFQGLQQYKAPIGAILEYFSGIKPPEYYEAKAKKDVEQKIYDDLKKERGFLDKACERLEKSLPMHGPKLNHESFLIEIDSLTNEVTALNKQQEELREKAVRERELLSSLHLQINLADEALRGYEADAQYLRSEPRKTLVCPTCNAEHHESFLDLLTYAEDARSLRDITVQLHKDVQTVQTKLNKTIVEVTELERHYRRISEVLETRRGNFQFSQVVESIGAEKAFLAFEEEKSTLDREIAAHLSELDKLMDDMNKLTDRKRSTSILKVFRKAYASALVNLNLPMVDTSKFKLTSRPNLSGSGGPRSILAYYAAIWEVSYGETGSFFIPLVIDSPNQQGQDDINLPIVIRFLSEKLPSNAQLILGSEIHVEYKFDNEIILEKPYRLLNEESMKEVEALLEPLIKSMYGNFTRK
jgi:hypothetical protein